MFDDDPIDWDDTPLGISSSMKEDIHWDYTHPEEAKKRLGALEQQHIYRDNKYFWVV